MTKSKLFKNNQKVQSIFRKSSKICMEILFSEKIICMNTTPLQPSEKTELENSHHTHLATARDVSSKTFLPLLAQFLQESGKLDYTNLLPKMGQNRCTTNQAYLAELEKWYCQNAASILHQVYLHPSFQSVFQKARGGSHSENLSKAQKIAQESCLKELMDIGWIIKDRTGIIFVSQEGIEKMDSIASQISQENSKNL